jgi:catechol 2,3-dioxygenase-like lactoylglutathione lyase family enzyme
MIKRFDHLTIVVDDLAEAKRFFGLLGFTEAMSVVISGQTMASYMGVADIVADHVTLVAEGVSPRTELVFLVGPGGTTIELSQWD